MQEEKYTKAKKGVKYCIILGAIALYTFGIWGLATVIISNSYNTSNHLELAGVSQQENVVSFSTDINIAEIESVVSEVESAVSEVVSMEDTTDLLSVEVSSVDKTDEGSTDSANTNNTGVSSVLNSADVIASGPGVTYIKGGAIYENDLGAGYEDVDPNAVTVDERGRTYIYGQEKTVWDDFLDNTEKKNDFKAQYYCGELYSITGVDRYEEVILITIDMLSRDISPLRDVIGSASYKALDGGLDERGRETIWVYITLPDGTEYNFRYPYHRDPLPTVIKKTGTLTIEELRYFKWFIEPFGGGYEVESFAGNTTIMTPR